VVITDYPCYLTSLSVTDTHESQWGLRSRKESNRNTEKRYGEVRV